MQKLKTPYKFTANSHTLMKLLRFTLVLAGCFAFCRISAQDPYFVQAIHANKSDVCRGEQVLLSARVANANYYEFQFLDPGSGHWVRLSSGSIDTTLSLIEHLYYSAGSSFTVRVLLRNSRSEITGDAMDIRVHHPVFDIQPQDLTQCNGGEVIFRASVAGASTYHWESSTNGLDFSPLSATTKFKDINTPHLKVTGIINSHHGLVFRCRVKDVYQCEALSAPAVLSVNQLSTSVSPTTSTAFCEGDSARFFPSTLTGSPVSFQWLLRKTGQTSYTALEESERFTGTTSQHLRVKEIRPGENSYRVKVGFSALTQNATGQTDSAVCFLESTRANYTIHPRPAPPALLDSLESCGPTGFLISGTEACYWYEDTLASPVKQNASFYQTPKLQSSRTYYYSVKDAKSCESYRRAIKVFVHPVPSQTFSIPDGVCPEETQLALTLAGETNTPLYFFVHSPDLNGFQAADSLPAASLSGIGLPVNKNTGSYTLLVHSKNQYCTSDTTELRLNIFRATRILPTLQDLSVCEGEKVLVHPDFEAQSPVSLTWYHQGAELQNAVTDSLLIPSATSSHAGEYRVKVSGRCGEEMSAPFAVRILPATTILTQPVDTAICENADAIFRVRSRGTAPLSYQWFVNGHAVPGNADSLLIPNAKRSLHQARVVCQVRSGCQKEAISDTATLTVRPLPAPPAISDTLVFCTSASTINLYAGENADQLKWYDSGGQRLPSSVVNAADIQDQVFRVSQTDSNGCESPLKPFLTLIYPAFTLTALSDREELCLTGHFNRSAQLGTFTSTPDPVAFRLVHEGRMLDSNSTGSFSVQQPGLYVIEGRQRHCSASDSLRIHPAGSELAHSPTVTGSEACFDGTATLEAASPYTGGMFYWWTGETGTSGFSTGTEISVPGIVSDTAFFVSYGLQNGHLFCESPRSKATVKVTNTRRLTAGRIAENSALNCAGYNPPQIGSQEAPADSGQIQWQFTENCENPLWQNIPGATLLTYNPGPLSVTTCFRRMAFDECDTVFSNIAIIRIAPDPVITVSANYPVINPGDSLILGASLMGGAGNCLVSWQVNRVSPASSSTHWAPAGSGSVLYYTNSGSDTLLHFRARVNCDPSSCNLATSPVVSVRFLRELVALRVQSQTDQMVNCYGSVSYLHVQAEGEGTLTYRWQRMLPGDSVFTDLQESNYLRGVQSPSLRIANTGNAESLHQARFRCIVTDAFREVHSQEIPLTVNRLTGTLANRTLCTGNDLHINLDSTHTLTGAPLHFEWQHRPGTGHPWVSLKDTGQVSGSTTPYLKILSLPELDQLQYRCAVTFASSNGTCVETTDLMTLKTGRYPEKPEDMAIEICQNEALEKIRIYPPDALKVAWYNLHESTMLTSQPEITTDVPGDYFVQYAYLSDKKCESPKALVRVTVHASPSVPVNTTPELYDETESLTFSAVGENLKWYRTKTLKSFEAYPPTFTSPGQKTYYVTQTDSHGCESERLQIQAEIRPVFQITSQPQDQLNCDGNTVTFSVRVAGGSGLSYQWQREYYGQFGDIPGATERDLRISDAGTGEDTDGARYRCLIWSDEKQLVSQSAVLHVNLLKPVLPGIDLCPGGNIDFTRYRDSISGTIAKIEWQKRTGNTYNTVFEAPVLTETYTPGPDDAGSYRLRITFHSSGGTCVRNSNVIRVTQHTLPDLGYMDSISVCEGLSLASLLKTLPDTLIFLNPDSSETAPGHSFRPGDQFRVAASYATGCITSFRNFVPHILPKPRPNLTDTLIWVCRFSPTLTSPFAGNEKTWWRLPGGEWSPESELSTSAEAEYRMAWKIQADNGCFSDSARVTLQVLPCYFAGQIDTCIDFPSPALQSGTWNYLYHENGEIFAALHPQNVNTGNIILRLSSTGGPSLNDSLGNRFYPRSISLNTAHKLTSKIKMRFYMSLEEINRYPEDTAQTLMLLHREEFAEGCPPISGSHTLWLKDTLKWQSTDNERYKYLEWETDLTGLYLLWASRLPSGQLSIETNLRELPLISAENIRVMPFGQYLILKSRDGQEWQEWKSGINGPVKLKDIAPYIPETYYRLVFDFGNNIRAVLDSRKTDTAGEQPNCILLENPVNMGRSIGLYFPDLQKSSTRLITLHGQEIPLLRITENGENYRILPASTLTKGTYYLKTENRAGVPCTKRIIIY